MQTFLPFSDYAESARVLDRQRLGKQRVECLQILKALTEDNHGWRHHPAVKMWRGHEVSLIRYGVAICQEWTGRGYRDTCLDKIVAHITRLPSTSGETVPEWATPEFCRSHQSNLKRKNPAHYGPIFPDVPDDLEYVWPEPGTPRPTSRLSYEELREEVRHKHDADRIGGHEWASF